MDNRYLITIDGVQKTEADTDRLTLSTLGDFSRGADGSYTISYAETPATGFEGDVTTLLVDADRCVTLSRRGRTRSDLTIERGRKHLCHYDTGYGDLVIGVFANEIKNDLNESGGSLILRYSLDVNANMLSEHELNITVRENTTHA